MDPVGVGFALGAAACWAAYILLTQAVGDEVDRPARAGRLACRWPAVVATRRGRARRLAVADLAGRCSSGIGLAVLLPVVPFSLEMLALRRLTTAAFGTLMSLEPAIALVIGLLRAAPGARRLWPVLGIGFVVAAGIGAERGGARAPAPEHGEPSLVDAETRRPVAC